MATGYGVTKAGIFSHKTRADMTNIVLYVMLPCNIFNAFHKGITPEVLRQCVVVLIAAFGLQFLVFVLNRFIYHGFPQERRVILQYGMIVNNAAFMGLPVLGAVFGPTGVLYGSIALVPMRIMMWTSGLSLFAKMEAKATFVILATHPCMWAVVLGIAYIFVPFTLPVFLGNTITYIGETVRVLPMFIVGSILCDVKPKDMLDIGCFYYSIMRLAVVPAIMFGAMTLLQVDTLVTGVVVIASAMPAANATAMLAEKYGQDSVFASKLTFVSIMLSIITLPVIAAALEWLSPL